MAFDTTLLDQAIAQRRAKAEIARCKTLADTQNFLGQWGAQYGIRRAYLFGSVTRPHHFTPDSDVDLAVEMDDNRQLFEAMSMLALVLGREVDMVELRNCHFARRIQQEGIEWK